MRILIVEDDLDIATSLKTILERAGYVADYVTDGDTAFHRITLSKDAYDLVILDLSLPKKTGSEVCEQTREKGINVPILILTAHVDVESKIAVLNIGADDYITKPFSSDELLARVRALLRRPEAVIPTKLEVNGITLNSVTRDVVCNGKKAVLTVKEFALLEHLMRHPNQIVTRDQILEHLWGFDFNSFSNIIDVHIKNLRKKLTVKKILETVRGVGYRICDPLKK